MAKVEISLTLEQQQLDWLQTMANKYSLPTPDKALRIVVLFAKQVKDTAAPIFKELSSNSQAEKSPVTGKHAIDQVHDTFLEELMGSYNLPSKDQAVHVILEYCMSHSEERTLFESIDALLRALGKFIYSIMEYVAPLEEQKAEVTEQKTRFEIKN